MNIYGMVITKATGQCSVDIFKSSISIFTIQFWNKFEFGAIFGISWHFLEVACVARKKNCEFLMPYSRVSTALLPNP